MKKIICLFLALIMTVSFAACGEAQNTQSDSSSTENDVKNENVSIADTGDIDVDLTALSSTLVYAEVYNMVSTPDDYLGKKVKMQGAFSVYEDDQTGNRYFACIIADATACCSQGLEFELTGEHAYPNDYPQLGDDITVTGTFETYDEDGYTYCRLRDAVMV